MITLLRTALLASTLLLAGCLRSTTTVEVNETGGGEATVVLAIDPVRTAELAAETGGIAAAGLSDTDSAQLCDQFRQLARPTSLPPSATVVDYEADGLCGHRIEFTFADGDELASTLDEATGGQAGDLDQFVLAPEGDDWVFAAPLGGLTEALESAASTFPQAVVDTALDNTAITYDLTLPGTAVDGANNADEVDGGRFQWLVDAASPPETLTARSTAGGGSAGSGPLGWILIGLGVVGALGLGAVFLARRSRAGAGGSPGEPAQGGAAPDGNGPAAATDFAPTPNPAPTSNPAPTADDDPQPVATAGAEPRWDPERRAWVVDHATEGLLVHDESEGRWRPA